jgi:hypothetical protein
MINDESLHFVRRVSQGLIKLGDFLKKKLKIGVCIFDYSECKIENSPSLCKGVRREK